jgi:hypothetical protein
LLAELVIAQPCQLVVSLAAVVETQAQLVQAQAAQAAQAVYVQAQLVQAQAQEEEPHPPCILYNHNVVYCDARSVSSLFNKSLAL